MILFFKKVFILPALMIMIFSCSTDNNSEKSNQEDIIFIPDDNFKDTLLNKNCVDNNGDSIADKNVDLNNDGKIQRSEAEAVINLILDFDYDLPVRFVDLKGIGNFKNIKSLKITSNTGYLYDENPHPNLISYDLTSLNKLEFLQINFLSTDYFDSLNLSGLNNLIELDLSNNRPGGNGFVENEDNLIHFLDVDLEGCDNLKTLSYINSFLKVEFCQIPSLEKLNMKYLEGGEPNVLDLHCLTKLKWLDISENLLQSLILKNSTVLDTFIAQDIGSLGNYPSLDYICIDDLPKEHEQITSLIGENTNVSTDCPFE